MAAEGPRKVDEEKNRIKRERNAERLRRKNTAQAVVLEVEEKVRTEVVVEVVKRGMYDVPDRLTGYESYEELRRLRPERKWNFVEVNVTYEEMLGCREKVIELMRPAQTIMDLVRPPSYPISFHFESRRRRLMRGWRAEYFPSILLRRWFPRHPLRPLLSLLTVQQHSQDPPLRPRRRRVIRRLRTTP